MKKARLILSALTRLEYSKVIEVEDNVTQDQLNNLAVELYNNTDLGEFSKDPEYFEKGKNLL